MCRLQRLETQLAEIPRAISLGCLSLATAPVRQALHGMALSWKSTFASVVHDRARVRPAHSRSLLAHNTLVAMLTPSPYMYAQSTFSATCFS